MLVLRTFVLVDKFLLPVGFALYVISLSVFCCCYDDRFCICSFIVLL